MLMLCYKGLIHRTSMFIDKTTSMFIDKNTIEIYDSKAD